ncbi:MAG: hypothetical protein HWE12_01735 [Oceanospirillaceae bacterium]|nr:hypothetical protein [Oceanospirillaceae bacterium]
MRLISFDPLRTLHFPPHRTLKPEQFLAQQQQLHEVDWLLYPDYWQVNALVFGLKARIFPSLPTYLIGHNKIEMTRAFEVVAPHNTPWTLIRPNTELHAEEVWDSMALPFVAKIPKSSMGEGVFLNENRADWNRYLQLTEVLYAQEYLPIDRDLRIIWLGDQVAGGYWRMQSADGFHNNIARGGQALAGPLPAAAIELVTRVATALGIDHAGFDIAMVDNYPYILEFNRMFGSQGVNSMIGQTQGIILDYLQRKLAESEPPKPRTPRGPRIVGGQSLKRRRSRAVA